MQDGGDKYGPFNWQDKPIQASIYYDAMMRHLMAWYTGEDVDPGSKSGGLHLAAVRAGAGILIDAFATGSIIDDRPKKAASAAAAIARLSQAAFGEDQEGVNVDHYCRDGRDRRLRIHVSVREARSPTTTRRVGAKRAIQ